MGQRGTVSEAKTRAIAAGIAAGMVSAMAILTLSHGKAEARAMAVEGSNPEVLRIAKSGDTDSKGARRKMVAFYRKNGFAFGGDYTIAAQLLAVSNEKDELLLAHDLALAGLALGDGSARPVVASTEDRIFSGNGLGERFGTLGGKDLPLSENHRLLFAQPATAKSTVAD